MVRLAMGQKVPTEGPHGNFGTNPFENHPRRRNKETEKNRPAPNPKPPHEQTKTTKISCIQKRDEEPSEIRNVPKPFHGHQEKNTSKNIKVTESGFETERIPSEKKYGNKSDPCRPGKRKVRKGN